MLNLLKKIFTEVFQTLIFILHIEHLQLDVILSNPELKKNVTLADCERSDISVNIVYSDKSDSNDRRYIRDSLFSLEFLICYTKIYLAVIIFFS